MKKLLNIFIIILYTIFLCGFSDISDKKNNEVNTDLIDKSNYTINPDYEEYEKLTDEEKQNIPVIPNKYIHEYKIAPSVYFNGFSPKNYVSALPTTYDLRNVGGKRYIPAIKNQGTLGLCWAFASNSTLESYLLKSNMGSYNFSENQPDYVARYLKDTSTFGSGNSIYNIIKYWFRGYTPVNESYFGAYFQVEQTKSMSQYINNDNTAIDIREALVYPYLDTEYYMENKGFNFTKSLVSSYNQMIKQHLMDYGALTSTAYMYFYNSSKNLLYNNGSLPWSTYASTGHAITIIGWNDSYGDINSDGLNDGAWIAMNSWGTNNPQYFYISYYDIDVVSTFTGVSNLKEKTWTNTYFSNQGFYNNITNESDTFVFKKGLETETLDSVKIFYEGSSTEKFSVEVTDGINSFVSAEKTMNYGINTFTFGNMILSGEEVHVTVNGGYNEDYSISLFTKESTTAKALYIYEYSTNNFKNEINNVLKYHLITKNLASGTSYTVKVYDELNNDITSSFTQTKTDMINGYSSFNLKLNTLLTANSFRVVVTSSTVSDQKNYNIIRMSGNGTESNPYIITEAEELILMNNSSNYYKLGNNIDMQKSTTDNLYGIYYNNGTGWNPINFLGNFDGDNHIIYNLYSSNGGLFNNLNKATVENLKLDGFNINTTGDKISEVGILSNVVSFNAEISNISIENSNIYSPYCAGGITGVLYSGSIKNVKVNANINSEELSAGASCYAILTDSDINIENVFIDKSTIYVNTSSDSYTGYLFSYLVYIADTTGYMPKAVIYNNRFNTSNSIESGVKNASLLSGANSYYITSNGVENTTYNPFETDIFRSDNYVLNDTDMLSSSSYNGFFTNDIWKFDSISGAYLSSFEKAPDLPDISMSYRDATMDNNIILGIEPNTSLNVLKSNIIIDDSLDYNVYNKDATVVKNEIIIGTGSYITVNNGYYLVNYEIVVYGDVSGDGKVNISDVLKTADYSIATADDKKNIFPLTSQVKASDVNKDSKINISDVLKIADYSISPSLGF